jgi:hypothetical protein
VKLLQESIFRVAAILGLPLETETLEFINVLKYPYSSLHIIAERYKDNEEFKLIILRKMEESNNPHFISELLKAILILKDKIDNWQELIISNVRKFQIVDGNLIKNMQESNLINQDLILNLLNDGDKWSLEFIREFFTENPEILTRWQEVKKEFKNILETSLENTKDNIILNKKEVILKLIIDLQDQELVHYCIGNFKILTDSNLKKLAIFPILKFGKESLMLELKELMKNDSDIASFVLNFIASLDRNDWKFFY